MMPNRSHVMIRLSQYAVAWTSAFLATALLAVILHYLLHVDMIQAIDGLLGVALAILTLLVVAGVLFTLIGKEGFATKAAVVILAVLLVLPLLWSPVVAAVLAAKLANVSIEYSGVYAGFRRVVGEILMAITQGTGAAITTVWPIFETLATLFGFVASLLEITRLLRRRRA